LRLETERLILRPLETGDAEDIHVVWSDASTFEYLGSDPNESIEETLEVIARLQQRVKDRGLALGAVVERASGRVIGDCGLQHLEGGEEVEVGYRMGREFRGRGYTTEAARAWLSYGFETLGLERIVAVARPENGASRRVMEKLGMTLVGPGHHYGADTVVYEIRRAEAGRGSPGG
jgi:RimJ/RimL family protein N-acetyltransferase